jgi:putative ABC transport system permease protein
VRALKQVLALCFVALKTVPQRWGPSLVVILGVAGVVAVLLSVLAISESLVRTIDGSGRADRAIVLRNSATSENISFIDRESATKISSAPGIRKDSDGRPIVSAEVLSNTRVMRKSDGKRAEVVLRGVSPVALALRPEIKLTAGRMMRPGFYELIVGQAAVAQFRGLQLNDRLVFRGARWVVVGTFESGGDARETELLADAEMLSTAIQRNGFNSISVLLDSPQAIRPFRDALTTDPSLVVKVYRESDYYKMQSEPLRSSWSFVAYVASSIMALGAMFGAANTMYSAVSARSTEIATLRAIGFKPTAVMMSIVVEAVALALLGALLGTAIVWLLFSGGTFSARLGAGAVVSKLSLDFALVGLGIGWACAISVVGGAIPAIRAVRQPIAAALRAA